jgi:hypothetical protein
VLITPYFVFVHVPKTGGIWLKGVLPRDWWVQALDAHTERWRVPKEYADLPVLAFVRNPWDWYVSLYEYGRRLEVGEDDQVHSLFFNGDSFESFLNEALSTRTIPDLIGDWMRRYDLDYYTALFRAMTQPVETTWIGRFENLREDLLRFAEEHDVPISPEIRAKILNAPRRNVSKRRPYRSYYNDELRDLVATRSRPMVRLFGYSF